MTLPTVIAKYKEKATVSQLKKVYSVLSQAYSMAVLEYGSPETWGMGGMYDEDSHIIMAKKLSKHMKLLYSCIDSDSRKCRNLTYESNISRPVVLSDGTFVSFRVWSGNCDFGFSGKFDCGSIFVDLNGKKLPNKRGEDSFQFYVTKTGILPYGLKDSELTFEKGCNRTVANPYPDYSNGNNMYTCTGWVIYNENMDYLHCDDLSWDGKKKCK